MRLLHVYTSLIDESINIQTITITMQQLADHIRESKFDEYCVCAKSIIAMKLLLAFGLYVTM